MRAKRPSTSFVRALSVALASLLTCASPLRTSAVAQSDSARPGASSVTTSAPTLTVNSLSDPGAGVCDATECTLREAITQANALAGPDTITFDPAAFAAPGPHTINLSSALPDLSTDMTIQGPGASVLTVRRDTGGIYRIFTIGAGHTVTISGLTISNGFADGNTPADSGGGILNLGALTLTNSTVSGNTAIFCGGGICNWGDSATAEVINSTVSGNYSDFNGGGIENRSALTIRDSTVSGNSTRWDGGGIQNALFATACNVVNSTVSGNTAVSGGGVYSDAPLTLTSSTVSGNSAAGEGGAIWNRGPLNLTSVTVTNNRADADDDGTGTGGGIYIRVSTPPLLQNTIVADNYRGATATTENDVNGPGTLDSSSSFNLFGTGGSGGLTGETNNNQVGVANPGLGPLADNGGPTQTHALLPGSPAIDRGDDFGLNTDQRGSPRPVDNPPVANASDGSDIGAFEAQATGRVLRVAGNDNAASDSRVTLPVELVSLGDENTIVFSLTFDPALLRDPRAELGAHAAVASLLVNASQAAEGRFGVALALPAGTSFSAGTRHILNVTFLSATVTAATATEVGFGDRPLVREVADFNARPAAADYVAGSVTLLRGFESDVAPRPRGSSTGVITATDWAQVGRFAAGFDTAAPGSEFQRADSSPRTEPEVRGPDPLGDGVISPADWVQAGRYAALLDPPTQAGGPTAPAQQQQASFAKAGDSAARTAEGAEAAATVRLAGTSFVPGQANTLTVEMEAAQGSVNALGFSLAFDTAHLTFLSARLSEEAGGRGATLSVNQLGAQDGRLGLLLGLPAGQTFPAGTRQLVKVTFGAPARPAVASTQVGFDGRVVVREVVDAQAKALPSSFVPAAVTFDGRAQTLQFGAARFTAREGDGSVQVTINRAGDLSGVATLDYATADGTASERQDYTTALGTLRFEPGEASKTVSILLVDDAKAEGEQTFLLKLSNVTGGASLGSADSVEVVIIDDDATDAETNPADSTEFFVRQHYYDFLSREPDAAGLAFWINNIDKCGADSHCREVKRVDTSAAFFLSIEYQQTGYLAYRLRRATFNRLPLYRELMHDTQEIGREVIVGSAGWEQKLEDNKRAFARSWVERPEVLAELPADMTAARFVDRLFANAGVTPTTSERDAALAAFGAGGVEGRAAALRSAAESGSVYNRQYNPAFVLMQYVGYLRRNPNDAPDADLTGYNFWLAKLDSFSLPGEDVRDPATAQRRVQRAEMVRAFIVSDEYRRRFGR
jgi:CSLREA domain-containing protein